MNSELSDIDRRALIEYRLTRAEETIKEAIYNADGCYYNTAVNRLYYAAYYATSALLLADGIQASTHAGIKNQLSLNYIRTGKLDITHGKTFMMLFENRQSGDYEDFVYCDEELFSILLPRTEAFISAIRSSLNRKKQI